MNPHAAPGISPIVAIASLRQHRGLIVSLIRRDVVGRYRGSALGLLWSFFNPVLMLVVYTFVFSIVFKARWTAGSDSKTEFALVLFTGLVVFNLFAECIQRAPGLVLGNVNYVKRVVFPLEILPIVALGSALFHMVIGLVVWIVFYVIFFGIPPLTSLLFPLVLLPLVLLTLGLSWFLASLGVFLRDVGQVVGVMTTALMFLSPIFYPITALPDQYRLLVQLSPLTITVESSRSVLVWGDGINWSEWGACLLASTVVAWLGFAWFQKTRKGFADVL
ncbi:MAG: ABC transporter permease [Pseudomonadota bacterium]